MRISARALRTTAFLTMGALVALVASGCAPSKNLISSSYLWPWKQAEDAPGLLADLAKPFPRVATRSAIAPPIVTTAGPSEFDDEHELVDRYVERFAEGDLQAFYRRSLKRSGRYLSRMTAILEKQGLPKELAYLPLIESGFTTHARSHAGAVGPWQFIRATGRRYGLRVDYYVDERKDPIKSTIAAGRYLNDLYQLFGDWNLALAAYNTGEGNIQRILDRTDSEDFWDMLAGDHLHRETRHYVPKFLASLRIARAPEKYGFESPELADLNYDWVHVNHALPLAKVADMSGTTKKVIADMNPAILRGIVPRSGYTLKIPRGKKKSFQVASAKIDPSLYAWNPRSGHCHDDTGRHCVRRGETPGSIARRYGVSARTLMRENGITNARRLKVGQALYIPGQVKGRSTTVASAGTHKIRSGETIGAIARRYGTSSKAIMRLNGIRDARRIRAGKTLKIPGQRQVAAAPTQRAPKVARSTTQHKLRKGETLGHLAERYGTTSTAIKRANKIRDARRLQIGQTLVIPNAVVAEAPASATTQPSAARASAAQAAPVQRVAAKPTGTTTHALRKGENIGMLAKRYAVSVKDILRANNIRDTRRLQIGQKLVIPGSAMAGSATAGSSTTGSSTTGSSTTGSSTTDSQVAVAKAAPKPAKQIAQAAAGRVHRLRAGETLGGVAQRYGVSTRDLMRTNGISNARRVRVGRALVIPSENASGTPEMKSHTVRSGDSPYSIARLYGVTVKALLRANGIRNPRSLRPGQILVIPTGDGKLAARR